MCNSGCIPPAPGFLEGLRALCDRYGALLIFDEVITGFRLALGGAQDYFGVVPDLAVFGKALASGYPISVLAGRERWMRRIADGGVIHAGTMNAGNPCVAAALATLDVLERENVPAGLGARGRRLMEGLRAAAEGTGRPLLVQGPGPMFHAGFTDRTEVNDYRDTLAYDKSLYAHFVARMQERGVRLIGTDYLSIGAYRGDYNVPVHLTLLGAEVIIVEGLDLRDVEPGPHTLICLPIALPADGAPCRAVLLPPGALPDPLSMQNGDRS